MDNEVILVNESDEPLGTIEKIEAHRQAQLHRAFSVFIFNIRGEMLLQQRAMDKYHSPGLWTNACCSHPKPGEDTRLAAIKRLEEEMGVVTDLTKIFDFIYKVDFDNGLSEHEFDHVYVGFYDGPIDRNKKEVNDYCFRSLEEIELSLSKEPEKFTYWFQVAFSKVKEWAIDGLPQLKKKNK